MNFRTKIALLMTIFVSVMFAIGGNILITSSFNTGLEQEKNSAVDSYKMLQNLLHMVSNINTQGSYTNVIELLARLDESNMGNWELISLSTDESTIYQSSGITNRIDKSARTDSSSYYNLLIINNNDEHYIQISGAFEMSERSFYLDTLFNISSIYRSRQDQQKIYRIVFICISVLGFAIAWVMAMFMTRPISNLSTAAKKIADGDLSQRADVSGNDEITQLSEDFNYMADKLEDHIYELENSIERQELFMGSFAHELKTPMTAIIGYADILRSQELPEEDKRNAANYIFSEGKRLENLSLKMLELILVRQESYEFSTCQLSDIVDNVANLMIPVFEEKNVKLQAVCKKGKCLLEPALITSLLINLIDNAIKAMDNGGNITLKAGVNKRGCYIIVEDEGRGIPENELKKITDAFYRVDKSRSRAQGGVGLGLSLCKEIVDIHNGTITFENRESKGTRVKVYMRGGTPK